MTRKVLPGVLTAEGQIIRVTVGDADDKEGRIMDPVGVLTAPRGGHTAESRAAMSEFIQKCKSGEIEIKSIDI